MRPTTILPKHIAICGHGRGATSFAAEWFNANDYELGHERMGPDGIVDSAFSVPTWPIRHGIFEGSLRGDFDFHFKAAVVRDPWKVIATYLTVEPEDAIFQHRGHISLDEAKNEINAIALSVVRWTTAGIEWADNKFAQAEQFNEQMPPLLATAGLWPHGNSAVMVPANLVNHNQGRRLCADEIRTRLQPEICDMVDRFSRQVGYGS